jgi:hypothetical protein
VRTFVRDLAALAAAADLEHVGLADALELLLLLLLLLLGSEPSRFERAALRWHGRYCREVSDVDITEAQAVLACLVGLRGSRPEPAATRSRISSTGATSREPARF